MMQEIPIVIRSNVNFIINDVAVTLSPVQYSGSKKLNASAYQYDEGKTLSVTCSSAYGARYVLEYLFALDSAADTDARKYLNHQRDPLYMYANLEMVDHVVDVAKQLELVNQADCVNTFKAHAYSVAIMAEFREHKTFNLLKEDIKTFGCNTKLHLMIAVRCNATYIIRCFMEWKEHTSLKQFMELFMVTFDELCDVMLALTTDWKLGIRVVKFILRALTFDAINNIIMTDIWEIFGKSVLENKKFDYYDKILYARGIKLLKSQFSDTK